MSIMSILMSIPVEFSGDEQMKKLLLKMVDENPERRGNLQDVTNDSKYFIIRILSSSCVITRICATGLFTDCRALNSYNFSEETIFPTIIRPDESIDKRSQMEVGEIRYDREMDEVGWKKGAVFKGKFHNRDVAVERVQRDNIRGNGEREEMLKRLDHENVVKLCHVERDQIFT